MRDEDDGGVDRRQLALEPLEALDVEVVRRLVEEQQVGVAGERAAERGACQLAAGERLELPVEVVVVEAEPAQRRTRRGRASPSRRRARAAPAPRCSGAASRRRGRRAPSPARARGAPPRSRRGRRRPRARTRAASGPGRAAAAGRGARSGCPSASASSPPWIVVSPMIARSSVVLPAPFWPASASRCPRSTENETPSKRGSPESSLRRLDAIRTATATGSRRFCRYARLTRPRFANPAPGSQTSRATPTTDPRPLRNARWGRCRSCSSSRVPARPRTKAERDGPARSRRRAWRRTGRASGLADRCVDDSSTVNAGLPARASGAHRGRRSVPKGPTGAEGPATAADGSDQAHGGVGRAATGGRKPGSSGAAGRRRAAWAHARRDPAPQGSERRDRYAGARGRDRPDRCCSGPAGAGSARRESRDPRGSRVHRATSRTGRDGRHARSRKGRSGRRAPRAPSARRALPEPMGPDGATGATRCARARPGPAASSIVDDGAVTRTGAAGNTQGTRVSDTASCRGRRGRSSEAARA